MARRRRLGVQDALWLEMDRPNNLMVVDSVIWTAEPLDWDRVRAVMQERLSDRFPAFRSRAVRDDEGAWWWEEDEAFSFDDHVTMVELDPPDDPRSLQRLVAEHRSDPLPRNRPLWQFLWVDRYLTGSAVVLRSHHALADGIRMVQIAMSLFDATPEGGPVLGPTVSQHAARTPRSTEPATDTTTGTSAAPGVADRLRAGLSSAGHQAADTARSARDVGQQAVNLLGRAPEAAAGTARFAQSALSNPIGATHGLLTGAWASLADAATSMRSSLQTSLPGGGAIVDVFSAAPGDIDSARKLLLGTRNDATIWTGTAGVDKAVAWSAPLDLADAKAVARANGSTVNDVLATCVAGTLHDYLVAHHERCGSVTFMVPVNLKPLDLTLPEDLGNEFALVQLELPTDQPDLLQVLHVTKRRMDRIKHGHEAAIAFRLQEAVAGLSRSIYEASVDLLANRTVGVLTNVPGPPIPVYLAGSPVEAVVGWAPLSGDCPLSFTIYSYNGQITVGIACDRELVPDHDMIVDGFSRAFERLLASTPGLER
ncbi:MAG: WS/DGAT domain-containing protein [Acidimicrobiales bacterium]|jgi:diacylglycerol O-acyltransferase|nr:WS/DGAT domain-containing protein [Acidimicrobiales bacterium]